MQEAERVKYIESHRHILFYSHQNSLVACKPTCAYTRRKTLRHQSHNSSRPVVTAAFSSAFSSACIFFVACHCSALRRSDKIGCEKW